MSRFLPGPQPSAPSLDVSDLMWKSAGLFRTRESLTEAVLCLDEARASDTPSDARGARATVDDWRRRNLVTVARLIARAALRREESRGGHFRQDFPARDDATWRFHVVETR